MRGEVEEMPIDHGNEGLKLVAGAIRGPPIHQLGPDAQQVGIQVFEPSNITVRVAPSSRKETGAKVIRIPESLVNG